MAGALAGGSLTPSCHLKTRSGAAAIHVVGLTDQRDAQRMGYAGGPMRSVPARWVGDELWIGVAAWPVTVGSGENTVTAVRRTLVALGVTREQLTFPDPTQERRFREAIGEI